jgi:hypothetical protein
VRLRCEAIRRALDARLDTPEGTTTPKFVSFRFVLCLFFAFCGELVVLELAGGGPGRSWRSCGSAKWYW